MKLDIRHGANPCDFKSYDTERLRKDFLVTHLFVPGEIRMTYSHIDRIITGGACMFLSSKLRSATHFILLMQTGAAGAGNGVAAGWAGIGVGDGRVTTMAPPALEALGSGVSDKYC